MLQRIMDKYNAGEIKVIIGNTAKLGVGVDLNRYTTDIYQIDIPLFLKVQIPFACFYSFNSVFYFIRIFITLNIFECFTD